MYTNQLLEEKYNAQKQLVEKAQKLSIDYYDVIENEVRKLFIKNGWSLHFARRKGYFKKNIKTG